MYLAVILIDYISPDGVLTTYRITPTDDHGSVIIDRLRDIDIDFDSPDSVNIGGARVYNGRIHELGEGSKENKSSNSPLTQANRKCKR